ncbi:MAG TPA: 2Fe-2S iron-sulfur cluster-binding protein, partial [Casimicrobiaceae bacterium]|nr:2Fe-2S iron-sulfur cluster-binding protein [Casimicrobiaceae bacterium]
DDVVLPGMLYLDIVRSPHAHAKIVKIDTAKATALPGVLAAQADGHEVTTVEGLAPGDELHAVQQAFVDAGAVQCGFCTPGLVVATADLLRRSPDPSDDEIREALSGNLCRCTGYAKIFDAVRAAARA